MWARSYILELYDKYFGKVYEKAKKNGQHCNLLDYADFIDMIKKVGFRVESYKTHQLYDFDTKKLLKRLLISIPESHRHIRCKLAK